MIVDDKPANLLALEHLLAREGLDVVQANSGMEALEMILEHDFCLILLDVQMPEMDGFETAELIRGREESRDIPIIFVTAISKEQQYVFKGYEVGAVDYLFKPLDPDMLRSKVNTFLQLNARNRELQRANEIIEAETAELEKAYAELKAAQSRILQQEKMASIGQLAAGVAHEINNPMGYIQGNLQVLKKYLAILTTVLERQDQCVQKNCPQEEEAALEAEKKTLKLAYILEDIPDLIEESIQGAVKVKDIVQTLKSFSRVDSVSLSDADINECLDSTLKVIWNELKYTCEVIKEYKQDLPRLLCNAQQLNQVFMNLLINASHAVDKKGEIRIKTWDDADSIFVAIQDNGCGIAEENRKKIFEPFFTTKEVGKGTGLGLSIVYDIITSHGGTIVVESEEGKGTTFTIRLPREPPAK